MNIVNDDEAYPQNSRRDIFFLAAMTFTEYEVLKNETVKALTIFTCAASLCFG